MGAHNIYISQGLLDKLQNALFEEKVKEIVNSERLSAAKPESARKFKKRAVQAQIQNEGTVLMRLLRLVMKESGTVRVEGPLNKDQSHPLVTDANFDDTALEATQNVESRRSYIANTYINISYTEELEKRMAKEQGMKNPKPDRAYDLALDIFPRSTGLPMSQRTSQLLNIIPTLLAPFFILERKSNSANVAGAWEQAARGGATLVSTQLELLANAGILDTNATGINHDTFVYSVTIDARAIEFYVHFADVSIDWQGKRRVDFHIEFIGEGIYKGKDHLGNLRAILHNILDWGR